ncbi:Serine/threonine-protein kinase ppk6 [Fulvia fulva]|uniref:non-specific serine/threonine protein kinase n=1 Tax=Passalora fulva TaxID=5499 RepID=A0A9Q8P3W2_PASFU|nr:Serine/threonine-protein kinase ppk6 [Fulvia fulva]KAK4634346.1 Serine/threonine-protein kinase ppk6 [Fulvia fulva]KAK4638202.1 Serine/threonine-protein kinase ppk6 [Fulvia fulva]UJO12343.1 Serine/threonine-protein kinase ppk6 [Fulvia fulva]WPV10115.1 Serine/threonine-protein kinase ppk6 [Fulvia fulva]WPV24705.1 Serine/threonine-protein kinase ppk6 [Fulvia fulva]
MLATDNPNALPQPQQQPHVVEHPPPSSSNADARQQRPTALHIPKNRSASNLTSLHSSSASLRADGDQRGGRLSVDAGSDYDNLTRSPILTAERDTGLRRIRQNPQPSLSRNPSSPNLQPISPTPSSPVSRKSSFAQTLASPTIPFSEDLTRFPSESLHSFSFAHQSSDSLHNRQNVLKRSIEFMKDRLNFATSSPRIASAQAKLAGDEEVLSMMELLQKANIMSPQSLNAAGLSFDRDLGPLTGPAHLANENVFEKSFLPPGQESEGPTDMSSPSAVGSSDATKSSSSGRGVDRDLRSEKLSPVNSHHSMQIPETVAENGSISEPEKLDLTQSVTLDSTDRDSMPGLPTQRPHRSSLKRTYTDVAGYSLQHKLTEALAQPYRAAQPAATPIVPQQPARSNTTVAERERAPHGHRNQQAQAIFTTEAKAPWTITAANDLACLVFGVTRAEVRKLGIMEVIQQDRRSWLEERLKNPESGSASRQSRLQPPPPPGKKISSALASMGNGVTAKLLSKPPARQTYQSRRSKTEDGTRTPEKPKNSNHPGHKSRGVLLCGDVVPIRKMNGASGSASLWVKEKGNNLIWVLEEIAEDVAMLTVDEIGLLERGSGDVEPIFGIDRVRNGMDVQRLIPAWPKLAGTNTGAIDYDAVRKLKRFTARTSNSISIPITVDQVNDSNIFRISSFPHVAGILVVNPSTMRVSSSNNAFAGALFGHDRPAGLPIMELLPSFDKVLRIMTDEDRIALVDGIVIPEHSFRRARALLALREGSADAAAIFLRPSGLPAKHRDGAEIMVDVQMRVVRSDRDPIYNETVIDEDGPLLSNGGEVVYALWITYSRQMHAVNHGIGPVTPHISRPSTPPQTRPALSADSSDMPSPVVVGESETTNDEEASRIDLLDQRLNEAKSNSQMAGMPGEGEPYEHPAPDMIEAGVKVITKKRIDDFTILEEMGQGAYGQVKLARYKKAAAMKMVIKYVTKRRILVDTWHRDRRLGTVPLEIHVLDYLRRDGLQHPNIVEMADFFEDDINYYIEMKPHGLPGMDLFDYIELRVTMEERECRKIFKQVAEALHHLHITAKVVHRDIKDENVVLDGEGRVKLVDFGSAAYIKSGPFDVFVGTIDYAAPEVLRGLPYRGKEQDVWALGILLYTIVYKENPFYSIDEIMDHDLRVPYVMSEENLDLIRKMLDRDVERRIGIQAVLEHPWTLHLDDEDAAAAAPSPPDGGQGQAVAPQTVAVAA